MAYVPCEAQIGAQNGAGSQNRSDTEEIINEFFKGIKRNADPSDNLAGSPYLSNEFESAVLVFPKGDPVTAKVRYNVAKEEMQVKIDEDGYRVLHPGVIVKLRNNPYKMLSYQGEDKTLDLIGYFEILTPDNVDAKLLRKHQKSVRRGKAAAAMQKATPARYVDKDAFYIQFGDSKPVEVERSTKKFLKIFPEANQNSVEEFMDENNLKSRDEQDLKSIINFYNSQF